MVQISRGFRGAKPPAEVIADYDEGLENYINNQWKKHENLPRAKATFPWNDHDNALMSIVNTYNDYLGPTPGYTNLDWRLVKAILFVETGANNGLWDKEPMQSDNIGDSGLNYMNTQTPRENLIVPPSLRGALGAANLSAYNNIAAGVAYLLFRAARFKHEKQAASTAGRRAETWVITGWNSITPNSIADTYMPMGAAPMRMN